VLGAAPPSDAEARDWLAARGLGLVPVADPVAFAWPGRFLARWPSGEWAVLFGVPPGVVFGSVEGDAVAEAWVVAAHEPTTRSLAAPVGAGVVEQVLVAPAAEAPMVAADAVPAVAGRGLEGDRYFDAAGTFSERGGTGRDITLVSVEALESAGVAPLEARRNVVVRGVDLDALIGRRFRVGEVECLGRRRCEPCAHLQRLTRPGVLRALVHRGGLRADVVGGGVVRIGDPVAPLEG
jgi:MOSC domain-containing protein YiiM